jgi:hypothetical protein
VDVEELGVWANSDRDVDEVIDKVARKKLGSDEGTTLKQTHHENSSRGFRSPGVGVSPQLIG